MVKEHASLWNRSIMMFELAFRPKLRFLGQDEQEIDAKNQTLMNSASERTNPLEMVKKQVSLWNRSIMMFELGFTPKLRFWFQMIMKQTRKIGL